MNSWKEWRRQSKKWSPRFAKHRTTWKDTMTDKELQLWCSTQAIESSVGYPDYMPLIETLAPTTWPFCSGTVDWTYSLLLKTATLDEATPSSVQRSEAYSGPRRPDHRMENGRLPTAYSYWQRSGVGSRGDTRQLLALEKIPVSHQVERVWLQTQFLGIVREQPIVA